VENLVAHLKMYPRALIISKILTHAKKPNYEVYELLSQITLENKQDYVEFGESIGKEGLIIYSSKRLKIISSSLLEIRTKSISVCRSLRLDSLRNSFRRGGLRDGIAADGLTEWRNK
jgi:hypothetical protein